MNYSAYKRKFEITNGEIFTSLQFDQNLYKQEAREDGGDQPADIPFKA